MDPQTLFDEIMGYGSCSLYNEDFTEFCQKCKDLLEWVMNGGFLPCLPGSRTKVSRDWLVRFLSDYTERG